MKLHFIEDSQRNVQEIRRHIERYEMRNLELVSKWPNGMPEWAKNEKYNIEYYEKRNPDLASKLPNGIPEWVQKEILDTDTKISELKWTIYDD